MGGGGLLGGVSNMWDQATDAVGQMYPGTARGMEFVGGIGKNLTGAGGGNQDALKAQREAAEAANATQRYMYDQTRADQAPWREAGTRALGGMESEDFQRDFKMSDFQADPGYQFRMQEGMKALQNSASARGGLNSGATMKALTRYGQDFASNEYTNVYNRFNADRDRRYNRLSNLAGLGQTANSQVGQAGQNYANNVSANQMGVGNAIAAASIADQNRQSNMMGQIAQGAAMVYASDARLKKNIVKLGKSLFKDVPTYSFEYIDKNLGEGQQVGVMAQDLLAIDSKHPAVVKRPIGYFVNYALLERSA